MVPLPPPTSSLNGPAITELGLIAGSRSLPLRLAELARAQGVRRLVAVAIEGETDPALANLVDEIVWLRVGQLGKLISAFKDRGIRHCVMAGQVAPKNLFDLRPDLRAMGLLMRLKERHAHSIFGGIATELLKDGVELVSAVPWLGPLMPGPGFSIGPVLNQVQHEDIGYALRLAREVSRLDIGQIVVVKRGTVLAVEGFEGTDRCLARGGELAGKDGGAVAVKVAKEGHDMRFDIPTIGLGTIETCGRSGISVLGIEAGRTLLLDREQLDGACRQSKVTLITCS